MTVLNKQAVQALRDIAQSVASDEWMVIDDNDEYQVIVSGSLECGGTYRSYQSVAIAAFGAEPVAWLHSDNGIGIPAITRSRNIADSWLSKGWDIKPLYTAPPASEREQIRREHAEWSDKTFGDIGPVGPLKHLSKEALEAAADPSDPLEWADMQFLLWDAQRRMGISDEFITRAMVEKLAINKARQWPEPKDGEPRLHIKEGE